MGLSSTIVTSLTP